MGKLTGFLEYERKESVGEAPLNRIKHFNEFHTPLSKKEQERQGARSVSYTNLCSHFSSHKLTVLNLRYCKYRDEVVVK